MIPIWILTVLFYVSLAAAVAVTVLIGWQYLRPQPSAETTPLSEIEGASDEPAENG
jgi:hypothetical protein